MRDTHTKPTFRFIDLFAGIGGFHIALRNLGGSCVFASEIDEKARETYEQNHSLIPAGDIREFTAPENTDADIAAAIPDHDILTAGFPCQPFSTAGVSARNSLGRAHGLLDETQGTLFFDIARIIKVKQPKLIILENVKNLLSHDGGNTFKILRAVIEADLGYTLKYAILNAETVVPQSRQRCIMVAFRDAIAPWGFPEFSGDKIPLSTALETSVDPSFTISNRAWQGHQRRTKANLARGAGFTAYEADISKPAKTLVARYYKDGKECLIPQEGSNPRMLTPREAARLQGFPEWFTPHPVKSHAYKQFGNAVAVPLIQRVARSAISHIGIDIKNHDLLHT